MRPRASLATVHRPALALAAALVVLAGCGRLTTEPSISTPAASLAEPMRLARSGETTATLLRCTDLVAGAESAPESLAVAVAAQDEVQGELLRLHPDVVGSGASTFHGRPVIVVLTRREVAGLPARARGRACVQMVVGDVRAQSYYCGTSTGTSKECNAGTLGAIVTDGVRNYWLSNWHVFSDGLATAGTTVVSPGRADAGCGASTVVGTLSRYVTPRFDGSANTVDAAIAAIPAGLSVSAVEAAGSMGYKPSGTSVNPSVGLEVKKVGRATGLTYGTLSVVNATTTVQYASGKAYFTGQLFFTPMCKAGDSGSLIVTQSGNNPVALLFAASTYITVGTPIAKVYAAIGAHVAN